MATATKKYLRQALIKSGGAYGNLSVLPFKFETTAAGICTDSDLTTAVVNGTVVRLGILPAGATLYDGNLIVSNATTNACTMKVGFQYVDGVDSSAVPQDDDFFLAASAINATGLTRKSAGFAPVKLPKEAYLIGTVKGADIGDASALEFDVICNLAGPA